jgi:hypothetical protein
MEISLVYSFFFKFVPSIVHPNQFALSWIQSGADIFHEGPFSLHHTGSYVTHRRDHTYNWLLRGGRNQKHTMQSQQIKT